jgi:hypothetical protein
LLRVASYAESTVKQPFVNIDENSKMSFSPSVEAELQAGIDRAADFPKNEIR